MLGAIIGDIAGSKYEFNNTFDYDFEMFGEGCDFTNNIICTVAMLPIEIQAQHTYQKAYWMLLTAGCSAKGAIAEEWRRVDWLPKPQP